MSKLTARLALLGLLGCHEEPRRPEPRAIALPSSSSSARPLVEIASDASTAPCPAVWPEDTKTQPGIVIRDAVAVCVDNRRFEGLAFHELAAALGARLSDGQKPKCAAGYPQLILLTKDGARANLLFCANERTRNAYLSSGKLVVADPESVERWLRARGLIEP